VKVAHVRSATAVCCLPGYPRETQEMVFDAHDRAFALFKHLHPRIYDNMKTAVETIFVGKGRLYNRRFCRCAVTICRSDRLHAGVGLGEGQVETRSGWSGSASSRHAAVQKTRRVKRWLLDKCIAYAKAHRHPELPIRRSGRFEASVPSSFLCRRLTASMRDGVGLEDLPGALDNNKYSVAASAVGRRSRSRPMPTAS